MENLPAQTVSTICEHMNEDHADAVAAYARHFARLTDVRSALLSGIDAEGMDLDVETAGGPCKARIAFDHRLADAADARNTLIRMALEAAP